eukprot:jgi/Undpi1/11739/HiC_scaffold_37.g14034.m1
MDAILERAAVAEAPPPSRNWLAAAVVLLGLGVFIAIAAWQPWDDTTSASDQQDPQDPLKLYQAPAVPEQQTEIRRILDLARASKDVTAMRLYMPLNGTRSLDKFAQLRHLSVEISPATMAAIMRNAPKGKNLEVLRTTPNLATLSLEGLPIAAVDFAELASLKELRGLRLVALTEAGDKQAMIRPFDLDLCAAIATHGRASFVHLGEGQIEPEAIAALADSATLRELVIDRPRATTAEALTELALLGNIENLELRMVHAASIEGPVGTAGRQTGSKALSPAVLKAIASMKKLRSLTLTQCALTPEIVAALPHTLERLDVSSCSGVDATLTVALGNMPFLQELGVPLPLQRALGPRNMMDRDPPTGADRAIPDRAKELALAWIKNRPWRSLILHGVIDGDVAEAVAGQQLLEHLVVTSAIDSVSLGFVEHLPKLRQVTFLDQSVSGALVEPLVKSNTLRAVDFVNCKVSFPPSHNGDPGSLLSEDVKVRWLTR